MNRSNRSIRCGSHTLNLIATHDTDPSTFDVKSFPKKNTLRQAMSKMSALWNKIGRSIVAAEQSLEAFGIQLVQFVLDFWVTGFVILSSFYLFIGVSLPTPCATRWNSTYDSLESFLKHHKSVEHSATLFTALKLPVLTKEDIEILNEYTSLMKPLAIVLDIFQGEKSCFLGLGIVLPLLSKLKKQLQQRVFPNLGPIRNRVVSSINQR